MSVKNILCYKQSITDYGNKSISLPATKSCLNKNIFFVTCNTIISLWVTYKNEPPLETMLNKLISLAFIFVFLILLSCKKEEIIVCPVEEGPVVGILRYTYPLETDGCEWLIEIKSINYSPVALPEKFKNKEAGKQKVLVTFETTNDKFRCELLNAQYDKIKITGITLIE